MASSSELIGDTRVWILPSTSGAANGSWRPEIWHRFADEVPEEALDNKKPVSSPRTQGMESRLKCNG